MRDVVIVAGCRTPIGTIGGQFKTLAPVELNHSGYAESDKKSRHWIQ